MRLYGEDALCCGCSACVSVCFKNAISMKKDKKGFLIPYVNEKLCVECGLCLKVCPLKDKKVEGGLPIESYAVIHKNEATRLKSRSGGVFIALADLIIANGGAVYGAAFEDDLTVCHKRAITFQECKEFQGSKYVQSDIKNTFCEAANDLYGGKEVLYTGTGCQIAGLLKYLKMKRVNMERLFTCDLVCHGNVSPLMYKDYRQWYEEKYGGMISEFNFRDKSLGWSTHVESFVINGKKHIKRGYTELYYCNAAFRESCYSCPFASLTRAGDFTLADCWGIEEKNPEMFDNKGCSLLLVNSEKAGVLFKAVVDKLRFVPVDIRDYMQPQLREPIKRNDRYEEFWELYQSQGFGSVLKLFGKQNVKNNVKRWIKWNIMNKY